MTEGDEGPLLMIILTEPHGYIYNTILHTVTYDAMLLFVTLFVVVTIIIYELYIIIIICVYVSFISKLRAQPVVRMHIIIFRECG